MVRTRNRDYVRKPAVSTKRPKKKKTIRGALYAQLFSQAAADKVKKVTTPHKALAKKKVVEE